VQEAARAPLRIALRPAPCLPTLSTACLLHRIETKNPDKILRLASERIGLEGIVDANTWLQVFQVASRATELPACPTPSTGTHAGLQSQASSRSSLPPAPDGPSPPSPRDGEEALPVAQVVCGGALLLAALLGSHYSYLSKQWIGVGVYITLLVLVTVSVALFVQELSPAAATGRGRGAEARRAYRRILAKIYRSPRGDVQGEQAAYSCSLAAPQGSRQHVLTKSHPHSVSMIVHNDRSSSEDEGDVEGDAEEDWNETDF
jgi:hypothetical protein